MATNNRILTMLKKGFTLIEILIVLAIIAMLATVVIIAINPARQFATARNTQRWAAINAILNAVDQYMIDNIGIRPSGIDTTLRMIGADTSGCNITCGGGGSSDSFVDDTQAEFDTGTYSDTRWDGTNSWVELTAAGQSNGSGIYTSSSKNAGVSALWDTFSWTPQRPLYKELPDNKGIETAYNEGNVDMTGNVLLMHMNEAGGVIADYSGEGNDGTTHGGVTYEAEGKFNTAIGFDGTDDYIIKNPVSNFPTTEITIEFWMKSSDTTKNGTPISYASSASHNDFLIYNYRSFSIYRGGSSVNTGASANDGKWHYIAVTWRGSDGSTKLYKDGFSVFSGTLAIGTTITGSGSLVIAHEQDSVGGSFDVAQAFLGSIDEVAIYNRVLPDSEILDHYKRGALRLKYQLRSGSTNPPTGHFLGPDGTTGTYYSELDNKGLSLPSFSLTNVSNNQYFQYKAYFETDNSSYSPELRSVTIDYTIGGSGEITAPSCLDLSPDLVSDYLAVMPYDPSNGSLGKTYYAIQQTPEGRLTVKACSAELGESISVTR